MKALRGGLGACALLVLFAEFAPVQGAWCNVMQVCWHRSGKVTTSYYAAPGCCDPCPQPVCTTQYVQRCYYQPVTTYQTRSYYEPVTTYRTSYYYEPVISHSYSCYYDPCTCSYQQVAVPTTSYRLRSQTCPVQSWVQRCCTEPVTSYRQAFYYEPVTTCCMPPAPAPCPPLTTPSPLLGTQPPPAVSETPPRNGTDNLPYNRYYYPPNTMPPASSGSWYRPTPPAGAGPAGQVVPAAQPPKVRLDRIVAIPAGPPQGQVVSAANRY
jgi:hypothetical protein